MTKKFQEEHFFRLESQMAAAGEEIAAILVVQTCRAANAKSQRKKKTKCWAHGEMILPESDNLKGRRMPRMAIGRQRKKVGGLGR